MCMYLVDGMYLGNRLIGYEAYDSKSKGFVGMTEKQIMNRLKAGERVFGFVLGSENEKETLELDRDGFNMVNLQIKSGVNTLSWLDEDNGSDMNMALVVVSVSGDKKKVYETVNARHARAEYSEEKLRMLIELDVPVAGVRLEKNRLAVCEGVEIISENREMKEGA